jgi:MFS family permease
MGRTYLALSAILVAIAIVSVGNGLLSVFLAVRMTAEHFSTATTGFVVTGYSVGFVAGSFLIASVARRVGHIRTFVAFAAVAALACLAFPLAIDPYAWAVLRIVTGVGAAGMFVIAESWLAAKAPAELRGGIFAVYMVTNKVTYGSGQLLLIVGDPAGLALFMAAAACFILCLIPISLTRAEGPPVPERGGMNIARLFALSPMTVVAAVFAGMINSSVVNVGALYAAELHLSTREIAWFAAAIQFGSLLLQFPIGRLSDRGDRRRVLLGVCLGSAVLAVAIALFGGANIWLLLGLGALYGGLSFTVYPIAMSHAADHAAPGEMVAVSSAMLGIWGIGSIAGPILATQLMSLVGPAGLFWYASAMLLMLAAYTAWRMSKRAAPAQTAPFVAMPQTPPPSVLDPRRAA